MEADYDLHEDATKPFMRTQATAQHVKNMEKLVEMVEHCTVQKCEEPWPSLYQPTVSAAKGDASSQETSPAAKQRPVRKAAAKAKAAPEKPAKKPPAKKKPGRQANVKLVKQTPAPSQRQSRSEATKLKRQQDTQPESSLLEPPAAATGGLHHNLSQESESQPPLSLFPSPLQRQRDGFSPGSATGSEVMSSASTQWLSEFRKEKESQLLSLKTVFEADTQRLQDKISSLELALKDAEKEGAHFKALYEEARGARDEWKTMVLQLLPERIPR